MEDNQVENNTAVQNPISSPAGQESAPAQKMLSQDQVNQIVSREKSRAAESARREAEERHKQELEALRRGQEQRNETVSREVDANSISEDVLNKLNARMLEEQRRAQMDQVAQNYLQKVEEGKKSYQDFDEVTKDFDPVSFPQLTFLLSGIPNGGDVLYDLSKNAIKLAGIDRLAERNPKQAHAELLKLSQSIQANKQAQLEAQNQETAAPIDRLQPSQISGNNGKMSVRDLRNQPWLRG